MFLDSSGVKDRVSGEEIFSIPEVVFYNDFKKRELLSLKFQSSLVTSTAHRHKETKGPEKTTDGVFKEAINDPEPYRQAFNTKPCHSVEKLQMTSSHKYDLSTDYVRHGNRQIGTIPDIVIRSASVESMDKPDMSLKASTIDMNRLHVISRGLGVRRTLCLQPQSSRLCGTSRLAGIKPHDNYWY